MHYKLSVNQPVKLYADSTLLGRENLKVGKTRNLSAYRQTSSGIGFFQS